MAKMIIDNVEYAYFDAVKAWGLVEKLSNKLKETFILSVNTGYPINVSKQRIEVVQYLKQCQDLKEDAVIFTSCKALQVIY